jgi:hypothetical protein
MLAVCAPGGPGGPGGGPGEASGPRPDGGGGGPGGLGLFGPGGPCVPFGGPQHQPAAGANFSGSGGGAAGGSIHSWVLPVVVVSCTGGPPAACRLPPAASAWASQLLLAPLTIVPPPTTMLASTRGCSASGAGGRGSVPDSTAHGQQSRPGAQGAGSQQAGGTEPRVRLHACMGAGAGRLPSGPAAHLPPHHWPQHQQVLMSAGWCNQALAHPNLVHLPSAAAGPLAPPCCWASSPPGHPLASNWVSRCPGWWGLPGRLSGKCWTRRPLVRCCLAQVLMTALGGLVTHHQMCSPLPAGVLLGAGAHGRVYKADWHGCPCAVKVFNHTVAGARRLPLAGSVGPGSGRCLRWGGQWQLALCIQALPTRGAGASAKTAHTLRWRPPPAATTTCPPALKP